MITFIVVLFISPDQPLFKFHDWETCEKVMDMTITETYCARVDLPKEEKK